MKWSRIKSIILYFLIAMNVFMLAFITFTTFRQSTIPSTVVNASLKVLSDAGFKCDDDIFPTSYYTLPSLSAEFYSANELSDIFFGKQLAFKTVENSLVATQGKTTLTVSSNYFVYETFKKPEKKYSREELIKKIEDMGFNMEGAVYDKKENCFYMMHNEKNLFNMYLKVEFDKNGKVCYFSSQWPKKITTQSSKEKVSFVEDVVKVKKAFPKGGRIKNIELGYSLSGVNGEKYTFSPAWRVMVNNELKIIE